MGSIHITTEQVLDLVQAFLDLQPSDCTVHKQVSYDGVNCRIDHRVGSGSSSEQPAKLSYILKVMGADDSLHTAQMEAQNALMRYAKEHGINTNVPLAAKDGGCDIVYTSLSGTRHAVRMLSYVDGAIMGAGVQVPELLESFGVFMGHVSATLSGFDHPALHHQHDWSMERAAGTIRQRAPLVQTFTEQQRHMLVDAADALSARMGAEGSELVRQVCHADANEANVLVNRERTQVIGIVDWGDACVSWRVTEVALAMLYIMLIQVETQQKQAANHCATNQKDGSAILPASECLHTVHTMDVPAVTDVLAAAGYVLRGFKSSLRVNDSRHGQLTSAEQMMLPTIIRARLALSLTNGAFSAQRAPENAAYLLQTQKAGWPLLHVLQGMSDSYFLTQLEP